MGPENKIKKAIEERTKKEEEMTDIAFLIQLQDIMNLEIKQMQERLSATRFNRIHINSIIKKLKKSNKN